MTSAVSYGTCQKCSRELTSGYVDIGGTKLCGLCSMQESNAALIALKDAEIARLRATLDQADDDLEAIDIFVAHAYVFVTALPHTGEGAYENQRTALLEEARKLRKPRAPRRDVVAEILAWLRESGDNPVVRVMADAIDQRWGSKPAATTDGS